MRNLTKDDFDQVVAANDLVLVEFGASWCQPCRQLEPVLEELSQELSGTALIVKVDIDSEMEIASRPALSIRSAPTLILFKAGSPVDMCGFRPKQAIKDMILSA